MTLALLCAKIAGVSIGLLVQFLVWDWLGGMKTPK